MQYCFIQNDTIGRPQALPRNWQNISNFHLLDVTIIASYGWYPCYTSEQPIFDPSTHKLTEVLTLGDAEVFQTWHVQALTPEEQLQYLRSIRPQFKQYLDDHMNSEVAFRDYDNITTATTWKDASDPQWAAESQQAAAFREQCFKVSYQIENGVVSGLTAVPTREEFIAQLPTLGWAPPDNGNGTANGTL
jgi:hypothetical protein